MSEITYEYHAIGNTYLLVAGIAFLVVAAAGIALLVWILRR